MADAERVESSEPAMATPAPNSRVMKPPNRRQIASKLMATVGAANATAQFVDHLADRVERISSDLEMLKDWRARGFWGRLRWGVRGR